MARAESITTSFSRDTTNCARGQRDGLSVVWCFCLFGWVLVVCFCSVWFFGCLFSLEVAVSLKHPEIAFILLCFQISFSSRHNRTFFPTEKSVKICYFNSLIGASDLAWKILYPITQCYSQYTQLSLFSCIDTINIIIGKTVELTDH